MQQVRILYQDEYLVVIEKPSGLQVHPPEGGGHSPSPTALSILKRQLGQWIYPVHRLDRATSGVLVFALSSEVASQLQRLFQSQQIQKTYCAMVRGWSEDRADIHSPLKNESGDSQEAHTEYETVFRFELPYPSAHHMTSRYSLVKVTPHTGRYHQIRRHFKHLSHPLVGDTVYGDGKHNRLWNELTGGTGLFLKAYSIQFEHPQTQQKIYLRSRWNDRWHKVFDLAGACPLI